MEPDRRHQQHPHVERDDRPDEIAGPQARRGHALALPPAHRQFLLLGRVPCNLRRGRRGDVRVCGAGAGFRDEEFEEEEGGGEDKHEGVAGDVVAAVPLAAVEFAGEAGGDGGEVRVVGGRAAGAGRWMRDAAAAGRGEAAVDEGGAEEPLRCHHPGEGYEDVAEKGLERAPVVAGGGSAGGGAGGRRAVLLSGFGPGGGGC